jgi:hypothetical protein
MISNFYLVNFSYEFSLSKIIKLIQFAKPLFEAQVLQSFAEDKRC